MIKLKSLLKEFTNQWKDITIEDVARRSDYYARSFGWSYRRIRLALELLEEFYYKDEDGRKWVENYLNLLNQAGQHIVNLANKLGVPYIDIGLIRDYVLDREDYIENVDELYPFPVYISADPSLEEDPKNPMTIGVMMDKNGKIIEIHEGNDEATPETINMVNKMMNPGGKKVRIYASHTHDVVNDIDVSGYIPKGLYVSPYRPHAEAYLGLDGNRTLFTGIIDMNSVSQESDLDWKTIEKTKIEKFKIL